jgi:hypothetical protein
LHRTAVIVECNARAVGRVKHHMIVFFQGRMVMVELTKRITDTVIRPDIPR